MKTITAIIEKSEDGSYGIHAPELKNFFFGEGDTIADAKQDFLFEYQEMLDTYEKDGLPIPNELLDIEFKYQCDLSTFFDANNLLNHQQCVTI